MAAGDFEVFAVDNNTDEEVRTMGLDIGLDAKVFGSLISVLSLLTMIWTEVISIQIMKQHSIHLK
ncbi:MAG: hypothetical protein CM15mP101_00240 [Flavobacteriaceae bacterium]|nr:MAG: hypothetical protein CM15mP101_00240 [Flavobacteriaceae bacterium]